MLMPRPAFRCVVWSAIVFSLVSAPADARAADGPQIERVSRDSRKGAEAVADEKRLAMIEAETLEEVNDERRAAGLDLLVGDPALNLVARNYSRDMVQRGFFSHQDPDGLKVDVRATRAGVTWRYIGENIARNRGFRNPANTAVAEWMKSAGHRDNILNPHYSVTGIGAWIAPDKTVYFTQIFIGRE